MNLFQIMQLMNSKIFSYIYNILEKYQKDWLLSIKKFQIQFMRQHKS